MFPFETQLFPLIALYAEIHFKFFPLFPSFLFKRAPEILFDCPGRLKPDHDLPILLILHDCKRFPVQLTDVSITLSGNGLPPLFFNFSEFDKYELSHPLKQNLRAFIFSIPHNKLHSGKCFINAKAVITDKRGKQSLILNDNLSTSSKLPFTCNISSEDLPGTSHCIYGDFHVHSSYSESHVEFGPPIEAISRMGAASGIGIINITDHSYDLACSVENYLVQDPSGERWKLFHDECNRTFPTIVFSGEEVSCLNSKNQVVHLCGANLTNYIPGTLDGARKNIVFKTQLTITQTIEEIHNQGALAYAAHPGSKKSILQRLFLNRGMWDDDDCIKDLDAFQAYNSGYNKTWDRAIALWKTMLAKGYRVPLLAGNDAHGDFNRYRAIGLPFINISEAFDRFFGTGRTGIYGNASTKNEIIESIKNGMTFITTGPYLSIYTQSSKTFAVHNRGINFSDDIFVHGMSAVEFGRLQKLIVYGLDYNLTNERIIFNRTWQKLHYEINEKIDNDLLKNILYIRAELHSVSENGVVSKAFTSGCFNRNSADLASVG